MPDRSSKFPDNNPGPYYVDRQCIDCDVCRDIAPENFVRNAPGEHSFVLKQPETPEEESLCREALKACPVDAIGDDGQ
jgi:ferredoxin